MQAVALRVSGDKAFFFKVRILGTQDTLLDETGSHYFYQCHIQGSVDFIFGRGRSLFQVIELNLLFSFYLGLQTYHYDLKYWGYRWKQDCVLQSTATKTGAIAAHHRDSPYDDTGFSFVGCVINGTGKILLGRAWGNYSRAIYSYSYFDNIIIPSGWSDWNNPYRQKYNSLNPQKQSIIQSRWNTIIVKKLRNFHICRTVVFGEYECSGRGADTRGRVPWLKTFTYVEVKPFLGMQFINGGQWLRL